ETAYYKQAKVPEEKGGKAAEVEWPPKYAKFVLKCAKETVDGEERSPVEAAFVDARRLARIRLVDCAAAEIRNASPLKENGPDPVRDKDIVTVDWLSQLLGRKRVPVKALLLDQANLSGVGNWVADEILYQARLHPEQYSNTFAADQIERLHKALMDVCTLAVETNADSSKFPETWLMKYRWDKGKKGGNVLPSGEKIVHLTVGGRTSAIVPGVQRKTAAVAGDVDSETGESKPAKAKWGKRKVKEVDKDEDEDEGEDVEEVEEKPATKKVRGARKGKAEAAAEVEAVQPRARKARAAKKTKAVKDESEDEDDEVQANGGAEDEDEEVEPPAKVAKSKTAAPKTGALPKKAAPKKVTVAKQASKTPEKTVIPGERKSSRAKAS
ncbi:hypothetical protein LTR53_014566, partial [Teratosphaeriaceae sp. CCFEE 6253]